MGLSLGVGEVRGMAGHGSGMPYQLGGAAHTFGWPNVGGGGTLGLVAKGGPSHGPRVLEHGWAMATKYTKLCAGVGSRAKAQGRAPLAAPQGTGRGCARWCAWPSRVGAAWPRCTPQKRVARPVAFCHAHLLPLLGGGSGALLQCPPMDTKTWATTQGVPRAS